MPPKLPLLCLNQISISNLNRISPEAAQYGEPVQSIVVVHAWWQKNYAMGSMDPSIPAGATCPARQQQEWERIKKCAAQTVVTKKLHCGLSCMYTVHAHQSSPKHQLRHHCRLGDIWWEGGSMPFQLPLFRIPLVKRTVVEWVPDSSSWLFDGTRR